MGKRLGALLAVFAAVVTVFVFVTGIPSFPQLLSLFAPEDQHGEGGRRASGTPSLSRTTERSETTRSQPGTAPMERDPGPSRPQVETTTAPGPSRSYSLREIVPIAWSYSSGKFAGPGLIASGLPKANLQFWSGLVAGGSVTWEGEYQFKGDNLCLTIKNLRVPIPAISPEDLRDLGAGYAVTIANGMFDDYTTARIVLIARSFAGDSPPPTIIKCFPVCPLQVIATPDFVVTGVWEGSYEGLSYNRAEIGLGQMSARLRQSGSQLVGQAMETGTVQGQTRRFRFELEGWLVAQKMVVRKKRWEPRWNQAWGSYDSWVLQCAHDCSRLEGIWYSGLEKGRMSLRRVGELSGDISEFSGIGNTNPPEVTPRVE